MKFILIETSTEKGFVALLEDENLLYHQELPHGHNNSSHLLSTIESGLKQSHLKITDLDAIAVGNGPGSYTGIRVGVVAAKSFAYAAHLPLIGVSTLTGFVPEEEGPFAAIIDAKIGGAYLLKGTKNAKGVTYQSEPQLFDLKDLGSQLEGIPLLITPQKASLSLKLENLYPEKQWQWIESWPSPLQMAKLVQTKYKEKDYSTDGHLEILYLRKTQAEIEKGK